MNSFDILIKRQIKLTVLTVIAVILMTVTISYALYQTNYENTTNQVISIGSLGLTATGTPITLSGLYPMEEYDLTDSYPRYEFTLENKTDNVYNDYTLMYELVLTSTSQDFITSDYQYIMYKIDGMEAKPLSESWDADINGYKILDGRLLSHDESLLDTSLNGKDAENHSIVFWLSTTAPNSMNGKSVSLSMTLTAYADRFNYLKYYASKTYEWTGTINNDVLGKTVNRDSFESISVVNSNNIPSNAIDSWDVSQKQNGEIMAWYTDNDSNNLYELYIGQNGGVTANPNSSYLFHRFINVSTIDVSNLNTSLVTNMKGMFAGAFDSQHYRSFANIVGLENFDTSNVTNMSYMFMEIREESIDLSNWNTSKLSNLDSMFRYAFEIQSINLSEWDTSNITNVDYIFGYCFRLVYLNINTFNFNKFTKKENPFIELSKLKSNGIIVIIVINECSKNFVNSRLNSIIKDHISLEIIPCVQVCYSKNTIPSTYTELDYIESSGTQYIDSGYKASSNTGVYADFQYNSTTDTQRLFGIDANANVNDTISYSFYVSSNKFGYSYQNNIGNRVNTNVSVGTNRHTVSFNKNNDKKLYIDDGNTYSGNLSSNPTNTSTQNVYIMANNRINTNVVDSYSKVRIYSFQIYESGTLVRNYVPAKRNSDNELGLYETINDVFYENSGTGSFNTNGKALIGDTMQIMDKVDARVGYTFVGWNTKPDGTGTMFKQGEEVDASILKSIGDEITLYAIWEAN